MLMSLFTLEMEWNIVMYVKRKINIFQNQNNLKIF